MYQTIDNIVNIKYEMDLQDQLAIKNYPQAKDLQKLDGKGKGKCSHTCKSKSPDGKKGKMNPKTSKTSLSLSQPPEEDEPEEHSHHHSQHVHDHDDSDQEGTAGKTHESSPTASKNKELRKEPTMDVTNSTLIAIAKRDLVR